MDYYWDEIEEILNDRARLEEEFEKLFEEKSKKASSKTRISALKTMLAESAVFMTSLVLVFLIGWINAY